MRKAGLEPAFLLEGMERAYQAAVAASIQSG